MSNLGFRRIIISILKYLIPFILTLLALHYLLKPGYAGFVDNSGLAPNMNELIKIATCNPWAFWYVPGAFLPALFCTLLNDRILAWKISIILYQYISFIVAYKALSIISKLIYDGDNYEKFITNLISYILALGYSFNIYIIGGFFNFYLYQFQIPQIIAPLYFAYLIKIFYRLYISSAEVISLKSFAKDSLKLSLAGFLLSPSPPMIAMYTMVFSILYIVTIIAIFKNKNLTNIFKFTLLLLLVFLFSNVYALIDIFVIGPKHKDVARFLTGDVLYPGYPMVYILTFSYKSYYVNTNNIIIPEDYVILSSLFFYLPFSILLYSSIFLLRDFDKFWKGVVLSFLAGILLVMLFIHGFGNKDSLARILFTISYFLPKFFLSAFVNNLTNLQHVFSIAFVCVSIVIFHLPKRIRNINIILLILAIIFIPIIVNFFYIHQTFYAKAVKPSPIPEYYSDVFSFIKNHPNATYLWIPAYGLPKWRGSFLSDIPKYLGGSVWVGGYYNTPHRYINGFSDQYFNIINSLKDGKFPEKIFKKYNIKYIIVQHNIISRGEIINKIIKYIENDSEHFKFVKKCGDVSIYIVSFRGDK